MKTVLLLSGGIDSLVAGALLNERGMEIEALSVLYGQRHAREVEAARAIAQKMGWSHVVVDLRAASSLFAGSALIGDNTAALSGAPTVVPNRNMVLLSLAAARAVSIGADRVAYGAHSGDEAVYPDCRPAFIRAMRATLNVCHDRPVLLLAILEGTDKVGVVREGARLGVPFSLTWSCYSGGERPCGECGACQERRKAFEAAGLPCQ